MNQVRSASIVVGVALLLASAGQAQVELKSGTVHLPELATPEARAAAVRTLTEETLRDAAADRHVLVRFDGPVSLEQRDALARAGLTLQTYVGGFAYVAKLSDDGVDANAIANAAPLRGAARMEGSWKIHPLAAAEEYPEYALINTTNAADPEPTSCTRPRTTSRARASSRSSSTPARSWPPTRPSSPGASP
jgi:hypothetical protein